MARLGDICIQITDGSHNPPASVGESKYLMLSSKNIDDDCITLNDPRYLSKDDFDTENKRTNIEPDDLLMTIVGTIGRVAIVPNAFTKICVQRSVAVLKPKSDIVYNRFLMYHLQNMRPQLERESRGVAQKGIYLKQIGNLTISLPPLDKQRKIAAVLDKVSDLIAKRRQQLDKLDEMVKARFVEMFGDPIENNRSWPTKTLDSVCKSIVDCPHSTPSYTSVNTGYMCIRTSIVKKNCILWDKIEYIPEQEYYQRIQRKKPEKGDIVYTREGAILGIAAMIDRDCNVALGQRSMLLSPDTTKCSPQFLSSAMNFDSFLRKILRGVSGSASPHINVGDIKVFSIIIPPLSLQQQFSDFVMQTEKTKTTINRSLTKLETLKKALMQKYFG